MVSVSVKAVGAGNWPMIGGGVLVIVVVILWEWVRRAANGRS
jgi:hypothetical protein